MPCPTDIVDELPGVDAATEGDLLPEALSPVGGAVNPVADPVVLTLGNFVFERFEIPESIDFGGTQRVTIHELVGGRRVVDAMGRQDNVLNWSGLFFGDRAEDRAKYLDGLRVRGEPLTLTWSSFRYRVVVTEFVATFERRWQIPYRIGCTVVDDLSTGVTKVPLAVSISETGAGLQEAVVSDLEEVQELAEDVDDDFLTAALDGIDSALSTVSDIATAAQDTIDRVLTPIATATQRVQTLINQSANTVASVSTLGGFLPSNKVSQNALSLASQANGFTQAGKLYNIQSRLGRVDNALSNVKQIGSMVKGVRQAGANLFCAARDAYNDATKWTEIASANDLTDPLVGGQTELIVPLNARDTGGVLDPYSDWSGS